MRRFCECEQESDCAANCKGLLFEMCRGTREGMPQSKQWRYRQQAFEAMGEQLPDGQAASCLPCQQQPPAVTLGSVVRGVVGVAKAVTGIGAADRELVRQRLERCYACDDEDLGQCLQCGCFIAAKARVQAEHCPRGLWQDLPIAPNFPQVGGREVEKR